jgi:hypothetical protein
MRYNSEFLYCQRKSHERYNTKYTLNRKYGRRAMTMLQKEMNK